MSGILPSYSNMNNWNFNVTQVPLFVPCLPEPLYPENDQDPDLDSLWANLTEALPCPSTSLNM